MRKMKILLVTTSVMLLGASPVMAGPRLPDNMLGNWCFDTAAEDDDGPIQYYVRGDFPKACSQGITITQHEYKTDKTVCVIRNVKRVSTPVSTPNDPAYDVSSQCNKVLGITETFRVDERRGRLVISNGAI